MHSLHLLVCNGLGFWVRAKQNSSSTTLATTSTVNGDKIEGVLTDDVQHITQPSAANSPSNFIATSDQSLLLSNQYVKISNDDDIIVSETSINEEPDNLSIDIVHKWSINVIEYLDSSTNDSLQQRVGDVIRKCRSIVKLVNRFPILMNYVLVLKKQFNIHHSLQLDCKSRWNSSYHLIEAILMYKRVINKINSENMNLVLIKNKQQNFLPLN